MSRHNIFAPCKKNPIGIVTRKIFHRRLDVITIIYAQDIPENICNRIQAKKSIQRHPILMTDSNYDYILYEIERCEKLSLKRMSVAIVTRNSTDDNNHNEILYVVFYYIIIEYQHVNIILIFICFSNAPLE